MQYNNQPSDRDLNKDQQGVDKAPGEEQGKGEQVSNDDLKGKKVDRDPADPQDAPIGRSNSL